MDDPNLGLSSMANVNTTSSSTAKTTETMTPKEFDAAAAAAALVQVPSSTMMANNSVGVGAPAGVGGTVTAEEDEDDVADIAFAAEAAAQAVEANDAAVSQQQQLDAAALLQHSQHPNGNAAVIPPPVPTSIPPSVPASNDATITKNEEPAAQTTATSQQPLRCVICQQGESEGRPIIRFMPIPNPNDRTGAPQPPPPPPGVASFSQEIQLHVFCGKTASILPSVNKPELEILTKAGLKNKHGIGPEVNAALARTRCATLSGNPNGTGSSSKEKQFYLVREFEAHLAAIRHTHIGFIINNNQNGHSNGLHHQQTPLQHRMAQVAGVPPTSVPPPHTIDPFGQQQQLQLHQTHQQYISHPGAPSQQQQIGVGAIAAAPPDMLLPQGQQPLTQQLPLYDPYDPTQQLQRQPLSAPANQYPPTNYHNPELYNSNPSTVPTAGLAASGGSNNKPIRPTKAAAGQITKAKGRRRRQEAQHPSPQMASISSPATLESQNNNHPNNMLLGVPTQQQPQQDILTPEGKVLCECGGTHWPQGTPRGAASWRNHVMTKKHQKWMEDNGMLGAV